MRKRALGSGKPRWKRETEPREIGASSAGPEPPQATPEPVFGNHTDLAGSWQFVRTVNGSGFSLAQLRSVERIAASPLGGG